MRRNYRLLLKSPLFDREYYLDQNKDVREAGVDPTLHFLLTGGWKGGSPGYYLIPNTTFPLIQMLSAQKKIP